MSGYPTFPPHQLQLALGFLEGGRHNSKKPPRAALAAQVNVPSATNSRDLRVEVEENRADQAVPHSPL